VIADVAAIRALSASKEIAAALRSSTRRSATRR